MLQAATISKERVQTGSNKIPDTLTAEELRIVGIIGTPVVNGVYQLWYMTWNILQVFFLPFFVYLAGFIPINQLYPKSQQAAHHIGYLQVLWV